ncbi:MAG TPA: hypothetical protein PLT50_01535 [bacterium]|nr:hypothetical protein [bacterium]
MEYIVEERKDVYTILNDLAVLAYFDFEVFIPSGSLILENRLNLEFLKKNLEKLGKSVTFSTDSKNGQEIISQLANGESTEFDSLLAENSLIGATEVPSAGVFGKITNFFAFFKFPKISFPRFHPKMGVIPLIIIFLFLGGGAFAFTRVLNMHKAYVKLVIKSDPLARSFSVVVDANLTKDIDPEKKAIKGRQVSKTFDVEITKDATGEKLEGEKASGEVLIYNRTESEITLSKGTKLEFDDLVYALTSDVTVPSVSYEDPEDPASVMVPGEKSADVTALEIGSKYNIKKGETMEFSNYKKTELVAKSSVDFTGGSSQTIKVVSEDDINSALTEARRELVEKSSQSLANSVEGDHKYIDGSSSVSYGEPEVSAKVGDEVSSFSVKQSATATGLSYSERLLEKLVLQLISTLVPESFEPSGEKIDIRATSLGNSDSTAVTSTSADIQVTAKTTVRPIINLEKLKEDLSGKSLPDATRILGQLPSVETYELNLVPNLPFLQKVPQNFDNIIIELVDRN